MCWPNCGCRTQLAAHDTLVNTGTAITCEPETFVPTELVVTYDKLLLQPKARETLDKVIASRNCKLLSAEVTAVDELDTSVVTAIDVLPHCDTAGDELLPSPTLDMTVVDEAVELWLDIC